MAFESRGQATFTIDAQPSVFNYVVTVTNETLVIWMEDNTTKHQWKSTELAMEDYIVPSRNQIPGFQPADYAARVADCLTLAHQDDDPAQSFELSSPAEDGSRTFAVSFSLQFIQGSPVVLRYQFPLVQVNLDRVDLLTARLGEVEASLASVNAVCRELRDEARLRYETLRDLLRPRAVDASDEAINCPITHDVMTDPVIAPSGHTYERAAIESHLKSIGAFDPMTNTPLTIEQLYPNRALQDVIHRMRGY